MSEYIAFISYRHLELDMQVADKVHEMIERYRIPRGLRKNGEAHFKKAFRDQEELPLTSDLTRDIYHALDESEFLVVICTPDTPKSMWVTREIEYFISKHGWDRVLTVLAAGTTETSVPKLITTRYAPDGVTILEEREPLSAMIAADTEEKRSKLLKKEFLRLAAAMLGCPYDALVQRNKRYRMQLLAGAMGIVAAVALMFAGTVVSKNAEIQTYLQQAQINESEALAQNSLYEMETGTRAGAIVSALSALPSDTNPNRPYVAKAEYALAEALGVYEYGRFSVHQGIYTEQNGQYDTISHLVGTDDGQYVVAMSWGWETSYLRCYHVPTGRQMWELELEDAELGFRMYLTQFQRVVLVCSGNNVMAVECMTGSVLREGYLEAGEVIGNLQWAEALLLTDPVFYEQCVFDWDDKNAVMAAVSVGAIAAFDRDSGENVQYIDISSYSQLLENGTYDDMRACVTSNGTYLLTAFDYEGVKSSNGRYACDMVKFFELDENGELLRSVEAATEGSYGTVKSLQCKGERLVIETEKGYFLILDLETLTMQTLFLQHKALQYSLDEQGNMLLLVDGENAYWIPVDWNGSRYNIGISMGEAAQDAYEIYLAGKYGYYIVKGESTSVHVAQVYGAPVYRHNDAVTHLSNKTIGERLNQIGPSGYATPAITVGNTEIFMKDEYTCEVRNNETGEQLGAYRIAVNMGATFQCDPERGYLYVYDALGDGKGLRISMETWEVVAELPRLWYVDTHTNEAYCDEFIFPLYSTQELTALGNAAVNDK